jgi:hypothetical protein
MRSWYMPKASAGRLAALVDDVHFATRARILPARAFPMTGRLPRMIRV